MSRRGKALRKDQRPNKPRKGRTDGRWANITVDHPLTHGEEIFRRAYLVNLNATEAYKKGFPDATYETCRTEGCRLLAKPNIKPLIDAELEKRKKQYELSLDNILRELTRLAFIDPAKIFKADGSIIPFDEMDEDTRRSIAGMDIEELFEGYGEDRHQVGHTKKIKLWPKGDALKTLLQYFGNMPNPDPKPGDPNTVVHFHTTVDFEKIRKSAEAAK